MQAQQQAIPRGALTGCAIGMLLMAFFGTLWANLTVDALNGWGSLLQPLVYLVGLLLLAGSIFLFIAQRKLPAADEAQKAEGKRIRKWFGIAFGLEGVAILLVAILLNRLQRTDLLFPLIALIVGIHFYPFAFIFHRRIDYFFSAITCIAAIIALFTVFYMPAQIQIQPDLRITLSQFICSLGATIATWGYGLYCFLTGQRIRRANQNKDE